MITLFGFPLCGTLFIPLTVGIATFFFFWTIVYSKKSFPSTVVVSDELQKPDATSLDPDPHTKEKANVTKEKGCGGKDSCCSKKNGKSGSCSSKNKAIETAKIFIDDYSIFCREFAAVLCSQFEVASIPAEIVRVSDSELADLSCHTGGSLCVFLVDTSIISGNHWLHRALSTMKSSEKPLSGMKYTVFMFQSSPLVKSNVDAIDQSLHKSGAVRVCRAESTDLSSGVSSSHFDGWATVLLDQVRKWNEPKNKACKCGPKKKSLDEDRNDNQSCSSSDKCSDSEEDEGFSGATKPILDLEDIGKLL